ncbi:hypothetical protein [Lutibacter maritimus]|uniref:Uncharacterized protein n=1 Tax=Lutibacter maritimus TaxID=593133 RepID=A0A1I6SQM2_9FLAO|nr:hypothetical protein [Lutibacter maritimus]SFS79189.1 hypothetical protein SAMN04488006_0052 [Lutibacter maritimus]
METGNYICHLCKKEYEPTKRGKQRFCSSKCRKKYSYHKTKLRLQSKSPNEKLNLGKPYNPNEMTFGGVKDAFIANAVYDGAKFVVKKMFSNTENANDLNKNHQISNIQKLRFIKIKNFPVSYDGSVAYFDTETEQIVYVSDPNYYNPANNII